jgi:hypothetical protein
MMPQEGLGLCVCVHACEGGRERVCVRAKERVCMQKNAPGRYVSICVVYIDYALSLHTHKHQIGGWYAYSLSLFLYTQTYTPDSGLVSALRWG